MKHSNSLAALCAILLASTAACAGVPATVTPGGEPVVTVDPSRHGNLTAAQQMVQQAYDRLSAAQTANNSHLGGHASRAKELLREANHELELAAIAADER